VLLVAATAVLPWPVLLLLVGVTPMRRCGLPREPRSHRHRREKRFRAVRVLAVASAFVLEPRLRLIVADTVDQSEPSVRGVDYQSQRHPLFASGRAGLIIPARPLFFCPDRSQQSEQAWP
jgi:hypothetical protein